MNRDDGIETVTTGTVEAGTEVHMDHQTTISEVATFAAISAVTFVVVAAVATEVRHEDGIWRGRFTNGLA